MNRLISLCIFLLLLGCATGKNALSKMTAEEQAFAEKVRQVQRGMTEQEVIAILGEHDRRQPGMLIWQPTASSSNQVRVQFTNGKVHDVQWIKLGSFIYEPLNDR